VRDVLDSNRTDSFLSKEVAKKKRRKAAKKTKKRKGSGRR